VEGFENKVFTITVARKDGRNLILYAIPRAIIYKTRWHTTHARFNAVLMEAPKPGYSGPSYIYDSMIREVKMVCTYDYEI
jgi:hypothetical protein